MSRKRMTQIVPWLLPLRKKQRLFCFYMGMRADGHHYAARQTGSLLPYQMFETRCPMYNRETGFDMVYQENKVFNLKLAAAALDKQVIRPKETFSFWKLVRYADRDTPYKDGLTVTDGQLTTAPGGGLCQMSNLLFWMFIHTPLVIVERHGHGVKNFPEPPSDAPIGVDATVSEGWLDLKVENETNTTFQINITFDGQHINGRILADVDTGFSYEVKNGQHLYYRKDNAIFEEVDIDRMVISNETGHCVAVETLYRNKCQIGYPLPAGTQIIERG